MLIRALTDPAALALAEEIAVAYLRGAIRGTSSPIHEDGRPFDQAGRA